jgi:predicted AAA+ superfamily ATPase
MSIHRNLIVEINLLKDKYPILAITGPRQSGKTTFLKDTFPNYRYLSMEDKDERDFFDRDPKGFFLKYDKYCIFDEAQRVPELFSYLQTIVDNSNIMGQYVLSGSQNFLLIKNITQSLAGRVALFKLFPFDFTELKSENYLSNQYANAILNGCYPAIYDRNIPSRSFYKNYIQTYVERDILELINIRELRTFRIFISVLAARAGQLLNLNSVAKECGITQPTAKSWLSILETSYIVFLLQPYSKNFDKRVIKSPKLYFYDTGLLSFLLKFKDADKVLTHSFKGSLFENMVIAEYVKLNAHYAQDREFWFWRDSNGHEVDLIIEDFDGLSIVEIKSTTTITSDLVKGLEYFEKISNLSIDNKILVYAGLDNEFRTNYEVVSWFDLK